MCYIFIEIQAHGKVVSVGDYFRSKYEVWLPKAKKKYARLRKINREEQLKENKLKAGNS